MIPRPNPTFGLFATRLRPCVAVHIGMRSVQLLRRVWLAWARLAYVTRRLTRRSAVGSASWQRAEGPCTARIRIHAQRTQRRQAALRRSLALWRDRARSGGTAGLRLADKHRRRRALARGLRMWRTRIQQLLGPAAADGANRLTAGAAGGAVATKGTGAGRRPLRPAQMSTTRRAVLLVLRPAWRRLRSCLLYTSRRG